MDTGNTTGQVETAPSNTNPTDGAAAPQSTAAETTTSPLGSFDYEQINSAYQNGGELPSAPASGEEGTRTQEQEPHAAKVELPPQPQPSAEEQAQAAELEEQSKGRFRLKGADAIIAAISKEKGIGLLEAADLYRGKSATPGAAIPGMEGTAQPAATPSAVQALETEIAGLVEQLKADKDGDNQLSDESLDRRDRLSELRADLKIAKFREEQSAQARTAQTEQTLAAAQQQSGRTMAAEFPALADPSSDLHKAHLEIIAEWDADPELSKVLDTPDAPAQVGRAAVSRLAVRLVGAGKFGDIESARASLKAPAAAPAPPVANKAPAPASSTPPAAAPVARRVTPAPGSQGQQNPGQSLTPAAVLQDVGFDPDKADAALYGGKRPVALGGR